MPASRKTSLVVVIKIKKKEKKVKLNRESCWIQNSNAKLKK